MSFNSSFLIGLIRQVRAFYQIAGSHLFEGIDDNPPQFPLPRGEGIGGKEFLEGRTLVSTLIPA